MNMSLSNLWKMGKDREAWHAAVHGIYKESDTTEQQITSYNTTLCKIILLLFFFAPLH